MRESYITFVNKQNTVWVFHLVIILRVLNESMNYGQVFGDFVGLYHGCHNMCSMSKLQVIILFISRILVNLVDFRYIHDDVMI